MRRIKCLGAAAMAIVLLAPKVLAGSDSALVALTEEYPPFNYLDDTGEITGLSTEVVEAIFERLGIEPDIELVPWVRAYQLAQHEKNTMIFTIARTEQRESLFKFVGKIAPVIKRCFYSRVSRSDVVVDSIDDLKNYFIGTVMESAIEQDLISFGFERGKHIRASTDHQANLRMLVNDRIDLWAVVDLTGAYIAREMGFVPRDTFQPAFCFENSQSSGGAYLAFSNQTPDATVQRFQRALRDLKSDGTFQKIVAGYR